MSVEYKYGFRSNEGDIFGLYRENGVTKLRVRNEHVPLSPETESLIRELLNKATYE